MSTPLDTGPNATLPTTTTTLVRYDSYAAAERAVDALSDAGFPVDRVSIVGRDVSTVEDVTGRLTNGRATLQGLGAGLWFGLFVGLLLGLFTPGVFWFGALLTAALIGGVWGAVIGFVGHWSTRGRRDFDSVRSLVAAHYDVTVDAALATEAARVLGLIPLQTAGPAEPETARV